MRKYIFILIGCVVIASTDVEAYRRRGRRRRKKKAKPVLRVEKWKKEPKLLSFEIRPEFFYNYFSMGDYNTFAEHGFEKTGFKKELPGFHNRFGGGIEFTLFYKEMIGLGVDIGVTGGGVTYEDSYVDSAYIYSLDFSFGGATIPLLFTFYYIPPLPVRLTCGAGIGIYWTGVSYHIAYEEVDRITNKAIDEYYQDADLVKQGKLGFHLGARIDYPVLNWLSVYADAKLRSAKIYPLEGRTHERSGVGWGAKSTIYTGKLWFDEKEEILFVDAKDANENNKNLRDGSVDFSGFKLGVGILFRF